MRPQLGDYELREGGKFTGENGLTVQFSEYQVATLLGDNKEGKSTALDILSILLARSVKQVEIDALINKFSGKFDASVKFRGKSGNWFEVTRTKSQYYVRLVGDTKDLPSPQATILEELGSCAYNPHLFKMRPIEDRVKYLVGFSDKKLEDYTAEDKKLKTLVKNYEDERAAANKDYKLKMSLLEKAGFVNEDGELIEAIWLSHEKEYAQKPPSIETLSTNLTKANAKALKYAEAELRVENHKKNKARIEAEIAALQIELATADNGIIAGTEWLEENKKDKTAAAEIQKQYDNAAKYTSEYNAWQNIQKTKQELDAAETAAQIADSNAKLAATARKEHQLSVIPQVKGIDFILEDEGDKEAGFYVDGFSALQLSETEHLVAMLKILRKLKCRVLLLDSVSDFGSDFAAILEQLKKEGWYILLSQTKKEQSLTINYDN